MFFLIPPEILQSVWHYSHLFQVKIIGLSGHKTNMRQCSVLHMPAPQNASWSLLATYYRLLLTSAYFENLLNLSKT